MLSEGQLLGSLPLPPELQDTQELSCTRACGRRGGEQLALNEFVEALALAGLALDPQNHIQDVVAVLYIKSFLAPHCVSREGLHKLLDALRVPRALRTVPAKLLCYFEFRDPGTRRLAALQAVLGKLGDDCAALLVIADDASAA